MSKDATDRRGEVIQGRYTIESPIGVGGFALVYRALQHSMNDRPVAIKMIRAQIADNEEYKQRFLKEVEAVSRINHPHIVTVHEAGATENGELFLVMELLEGRTLEDVLKNEAPISSQRAVDLMLQVCEALDAAHRAGVIHRDLKPANIFLLPNASGDGEFVKVLDFGIAKVSESPDLNLTGTGMLIGTPRYMSPEQIRSKPISPSSDIYAMGVILYELLTGNMPFDADTVADLMVAHLQQAPPSLNSTAPIAIPEKLNQVVLSAMAKTPEERPLNTSQLGSLLRGALTTDESESPTAHTPVESKGRRELETDITQAAPSQPFDGLSTKRRSLWMPAIGLVILAVGLLLWQQPWSGSSQKRKQNVSSAPSACEQPFFDVAADTNRVREKLEKALTQPPLDTQTNHERQWKTIGHELRAGSALWKQCGNEVCTSQNSDQHTDTWQERRSRAGWALEEIRQLIKPPISEDKLHGLATTVQDRVYVLLESGDLAQPLIAAAAPSKRVKRGGFGFGGNAVTGPVQISNEDIKRKRPTDAGSFEWVPKAITDPVQPQDQIRIQLTGTNGTYIYVVLFLADGSVDTTKRKLESTEWRLSVPEDDSWMPLRGNERGEITRIVVVASATTVDWLENQSGQSAGRRICAGLSLSTRDLETSSSKPKIAYVDFPFVHTP